MTLYQEFLLPKDFDAKTPETHSKYNIILRILTYKDFDAKTPEIHTNI